MPVLFYFFQFMPVHIDNNLAKKKPMTVSFRSLRSLPKEGPAFYIPCFTVLRKESLPIWSEKIIIIRRGPWAIILWFINTLLWKHRFVGREFDSCTTDAKKVRFQFLQRALEQCRGTWLSLAFSRLYLFIFFKTNSPRATQKEKFSMM